MAETFYTLLDVDADADRKTIRRAYRDLVKECHPDVSDDPAAPDQFRRLTIARDVLLDDDERDRYDRLGHDAYVHRHVAASVWTVEPPSRGSDPSGGREAPDSSTRAPGRDGQTGPTGGRTAWLGEDGPRGRGRGSARRAGAAARGAPGGRGWQHASGVYERVETNVPDEPTYAARLLRGLRAVGPWLVVHFVFILSALATGWFTFTQASRTFEPSLPAVVSGVLVVGLVVCLSVFHLVSQVYA